jgi:hypothetical protein
MIKTIVAVVVVLLVIVVAAVLGVAATKPDAFRVERTASIKGAAGQDLRPDQRSARLGCLVAVRKEGPGDEANLQRRGERQGRGL